MILNETVNLYISGGCKGDLTVRMQRALCNDMDKLFENIDNEINALPPELRKVIWDDYLYLLNDRVQKGVFTPPSSKHPEKLIIDLSEFMDEKTYKRTCDENFFLGIKLKKAIVEMRLEHPKDIIQIRLLDSDSVNAKILNALAQGVAGEWQDQVVFQE